MSAIRSHVLSRFTLISARSAALCLAAVFLASYLPDIGHGFLRDDFRWIAQSRLDGSRTVLDLFRENFGFYRPVVAATFSADYAVWGMWAFGYAFTNLVLVLANAALLYGLARRLTLPREAGVLAAAVWTLNFHGINASLLWISGRTALLLVFFSLLTALAMLSRRTVLAGVLALLAMLSKEEAVVIPALWGAVIWFDHQRGTTLMTRAAAAVRGTWPLWLALAVYMPLRMNSGAFDASDAPSYYAFTFVPGIVLRNIAEYADRSATVAAGVSLILALGARGRGPFAACERRTFLLAALWFAASFALTLFLPVRSSLYVLLPAVASALAAGAVASRASRLSPTRFARIALALVLLAVVCVPVYRLRNARSAREAELSARALEVLRHEARAYPAGGDVAFVDHPGAPARLDAAFGALLPDALRLSAGPSWSGAVWPDISMVPSGSTIVIRLRPDGELDVAE